MAADDSHGAPPGGGLRSRFRRVVGGIGRLFGAWRDGNVFTTHCNLRDPGGLKYAEPGGRRRSVAARAWCRTFGYRARYVEVPCPAVGPIATGASASSCRKPRSLRALA